MKEITLSLTLEQVQVAYEAINRCEEMTLIATPILQLLDVEEFKESYDITFLATEFENLRIAVNQMVIKYTEQEFDFLELKEFAKYLHEQRKVLLEK
jgi:hypothetical protein